MTAATPMQCQMFSGGDALLSPCGQYRYSLTRVWSEGTRICFIMLNPSTADAEADDPTIRRCVGFARSWGFGSLEVGNLFAYRATEPIALLAASDPVGPMNDNALIAITAASRVVVAAWGAHSVARERVRDVLQLIGDRVSWHCLGTTKDGSPRHPLYVPQSQPLVAFGGRRV